MENQENIIWWVWTAIYQDEIGNDFLLYSSAAPIDRQPELYDPREEIQLGCDAKAVIYQSFSTGTEFKTLKNSLTANTINLNATHESCNSSFQIFAHKKILQKSYGHGRVAVESYFTLPNLEEILGNQVQIIAKNILDLLQNRLGFDFRENYSTRLGCFEIHHLQNWLESPVPFYIKHIKDANAPQNQVTLRDLQVERTEKISKNTHRVHIICRDQGDEIFNSLITLHPNERNSDIILMEEEFSELEAWVFNDDGGIAHHEINHYMASINIAIGIQGRTVKIDDKLSRRSKSLGDKAQKSISTVTRTTTNHSYISYEKNKDIKTHYANMKRLASECFPGHDKDRWFNKSLKDEIGVIHHFIKTIDNGYNQKAIIVDPFFSEDSLIRLVTRIRNSGLDLHIVTSWAKIDPETGSLYEHDDKPLEKLEQRLNTTKKLINPKLSVTNLTWKNDQAFHDRYLIIYPIKDRPEAYLLSNSINNMAGKWPFCMSLLSPSVANEVILYAESLCEGKDRLRKENPEVNFQWESTTS